MDPYPTPDDPQFCADCGEEMPACLCETETQEPQGYGVVTDPYDSPTTQAMSDFYHAQRIAKDAQ